MASSHTHSQGNLSFRVSYTRRLRLLLHLQKPTLPQLATSVARIVYYLVWKYLVGFLNRLLGIA
jgi:hypothetical protein